MTVPTYQEFLTCAITPPFPTSEIIYVSEKEALQILSVDSPRKSVSQIS